MFQRRHHQLVAEVLEHLDAEVLAAHQCLFGGGTAIVLGHGEYRESRDMDFLVSDLDRYRRLRRLLVSSRGMEEILKPWINLGKVHPVRADQYGIRTRLEVGGAVLKFEIAFEARIDLDPPGPGDRIGPAATLAGHDLAATKLLANADRWAEDGTFSRDLIDLSMLELSPDQWKLAFAKAESAYGDAVRQDLDKAIDRLMTQEGRLDQCLQALSIRLPKALVWKRLRSMAQRNGPEE